MNLRLAKKLLYITGSVNIGEKGDQYVQSIRTSLDMADVEYEEWDKSQLKERFPQFNVSDDTDILWQQDTGFLHANECVSTHLKLAEQFGASIHENTEVTHIDWQADTPSVHTKKHKYKAKKIIITAGAWTFSLLKNLNLPLTVTKQQVCYYKPTDIDSFQPDRFPVFTEVTSEGEFMYGMPFFGEKGVKVARHGMGKTISPDSSNRTPDLDYIQHMDDYLSKRIPDLWENISG